MLKSGIDNEVSGFHATELRYYPNPDKRHYKGISKVCKEKNNYIYKKSILVYNIDNHWVNRSAPRRSDMVL